MVSMENDFNKWVFPHSFGSSYDINEAIAILEVLENGAPTNASKVREFEKAFASYVDADYGIATNSWGGAAQLVAILLDLSEMDEVIVPALTMSASANFFAREGANIVFAEVNTKTFNLNPDKLEEKITKNTKAIVMVHMCGQPCEIDLIKDIATKHNLILIQDAAHAPGAMYKEKGLGAYGDFVLYSFHQAKNMTSLGEGGMVVMNNKDWASKLNKIRSHGMGEYIGISCRMTDIQAAAGLVQLQKLKKHNDKRRELSYYLSSLLKDCEGIILPYEIPEIYHTYHLYSIQIRTDILKIGSDELKKQLWVKGKIMTIAYYPTLNCLECYKELGHKEGDCPITEMVASNTLVLPMSPKYEKEDIEKMASGISKILKLYC